MEFKRVSLDCEALERCEVGEGEKRRGGRYGSENQIFMGNVQELMCRVVQPSCGECDGCEIIVCGAGGHDVREQRDPFFYPFLDSFFTSALCRSIRLFCCVYGLVFRKGGVLYEGVYVQLKS